MKRLILCLCLIASPALAAIASTMQWDVRTGGVDTNGGGFDSAVAIPGQDFSQQNAAQVAFTDLVIGATTTQLTSALSAFATCTAGVGRCGNVINITGGAGCTVGWYEILSTSTITATMDRSVGTAASTCTGNLGGSLLTISKVFSLVTAHNTVHQKAGTYTTSTTQTLPAVSFNWRGYNSTHADGGTKPLNTNSAAGVNNFNSGTNDVVIWIDNVQIDQTAGNGFAGIYVNGHPFYLIVTNSKFSGNMGAVYGNAGAGSAFRSLVCENDEFSGNDIGIMSSAGGIFRYCYFHGNHSDFTDGSGVSNPQLLFFEGCVFASNTSTNNSVSLSALPMVMRHCVFYSISNQQAIWAPNAGNPYIWVEDTVFYSFSGGNEAAFRLNGSTPITVNRSNAFDSTVTLNFSGTSTWTNSSTDVTLTANPFTNAGSADFSLNSTAGGGTLLQNLGLPLVTPAGSTYMDIGALRHQDPAGSGGTHGYTFSRNKLPEGVLGLSMPAKQ